jgi:hypothetical protein
VPAGRPEQRRHLTTDVRLEWAERDLDEVIVELATLNERLGRLLWAAVGLMTSITTAAVFLAINLVVGT